MSFSPGSVIKNRSRLWRVDAQDGKVLVATPTKELVAKRESMKSQMQGRGRERTPGAERLKGIDDLSPGSFDLLTVYFPDKAVDEKR